MLTWIFYVLVLAFLIVLFSVIFGQLFGRRSAIPVEADQAADSAERIAANASALDEGRIDDVAFDVVLRGYRQDQVDALLEQLRAGATSPAKQTLTVREENS